MAMPLFRKHGIRPVKMDDIAKQLTISKRTLYEIYANKEELLLEGVKQSRKRNEERFLAEVGDGSLSVMDILLKFYQVQMKDLEGITPQFFSDIQRFPSVMTYFQEKHQKNNEKAAAFFQRGVEEGFFRKDVDYSLISMFANGCLHSVMESELYKRYDLWYIFRSVILLFMRGVCTEKGLPMIDNLLEENHDKSNSF